MTDEHDQKFATRNGKTKPSGESEHADRTPPKGVEKEYADFSNWMSKRTADDANPKRKPKQAKAEKDTDSEPDNSDQNPPGNEGEAKKADTDGEAGKSPKDGGSKEGELPDWMKRRLAREKKRAEAMEQRNAELIKQLSEAQSKQKAETEPSPADKENQSSEGPYDYDYPDEEDYKNSKGEVDDDAYLLDVKNWMDEKPLVGGKHSKGKKAQNQRVQGQSEQIQQQNKKQAAEQQFKIALESIEQAFDESETAPKGLFDDFFEQAKRGLTKYSYQMIDWMADNEEEAVIVATEFKERPRKALNIFRKPTSEHAKLLSDLAKVLKSQENQKKESDPPVEDGTKTQDAGSVQNLRTRRGVDADTAFNKNAGTKDYGDYAAARSEMSRQKHRTNVANLF